jgi:hypothetical protein
MNNTLSTSTLIIVEFFRKVNGHKVWYFGRLAAIYELFTPEQIGCKLETLWNCSLDHGESKITAHCVITKEIMYRKAHKVKKNK